MKKVLVFIGSILSLLLFVSCASPDKVIKSKPSQPKTEEVTPSTSPAKDDNHVTDGGKYSDTGNWGTIQTK